MLVLSSYIIQLLSFFIIISLVFLFILGLAEPIRLLLVDQGIKFIDDRINKSDWPAMKSQFVSDFAM